MGNRIALASRPTLRSSTSVAHPPSADETNAAGKTAYRTASRAAAASTERILGEAPQDLQAIFALGRELGRGQFGVTHLCTHKASGQVYACKTIAKYKLAQQNEIEEVRREVQIMRHLAGVPNIVELVAAYEDKRSVHLVMELCAGGELFDRIVRRGHYSERAAAALCRIILRVVQACHSRGVMHRDLKPENFLFLNKYEDSPLKVADFGASVFFQPGQTFTDFVGSPFYIAPEVLKRSYGPEADIWSVGAILYMLLSGSPPFYAQTDEAVFKEILEGQLDLTSQPWPSISSGAKDLVSKMLKQDPKERATAYEVLKHAWIREDGEAPDTPIHSDTLRRMKQFGAINKFKKLALKAIAKSLSEEEITRLKEMFQHMDTDNNGMLTFEELKRGMASQGFTLAEAEIRQLLEAADLDGNGTINYEEFITATIYLNRVYREDHLHAAFQQFDKDQSGYITMEELEQAFKTSTSGNKHNIKEILADVDTDKDGRINYDEFVAMMKRGRPDAASTSKTQRGKTSVVGAAKCK